MLVSTLALLQAARDGGYAVGAFNVYNLEGILAVVAAATAEHSPAMLQVHPTAFRQSGTALLAACREAAAAATVRMAVHLDHCTEAAFISEALAAGITSVMADGSHLPLAENIRFTRAIGEDVHGRGGVVEAELGRLAGTEDGISIPEYQSRLTSVEDAVMFVRQTGIDALAVCIGNVHGPYRGEPRLDFDRLAQLRAALSLPLVLHGASGLPPQTIRRAIEHGVAKFNVNTELREAYLEALRAALNGPRRPDVAALMAIGVAGMQAVAAAKLRLFGSCGK